MSLDLHKNITLKLEKFIESNKIPNIIFHGPTGSGKRIIVSNFINLIYNNDKEHIKQYVMFVDCAQGKGIKFVREDLKFFAKSHINISKNNIFKTIVMANADKLTIDAQSALRRCIELYNHTTRFFIIIENKYKLLKPILSRFCEICITYPIIDNVKINLNQYTVNKKINTETENSKRFLWLSREIKNKCTTLYDLSVKTDKIYEKGYSCKDIIVFIEKDNIDENFKWTLLMLFYKIKREFRNERLLMFYILNYYYFRSQIDLENIAIM
tara:strand:- start:1826 stop:2632 length:807 start_codon:yes stop_codon:yes gene_type:complete